jgi:hypothetical protein
MTVGIDTKEILHTHHAHIEDTMMMTMIVKVVMTGTAVLATIGIAALATTGTVAAATTRIGRAVMMKRASNNKPG